MSTTTVSRSLAASLLALILAAGTALGEEPKVKWTTFRGSRLIDNPYNDGDSFHVQAGDKHYVFRLYFVDTPETDRYISSRVKDQADYWSVSEDRSLELGKIAKELSLSLLQTNFTVYTKFQDAKGQGHRQRHFAMIKIGKRFLSEILVERGLARVYGASAYKLPDRRLSKTYWRHLRSLEKQAREAQRGGWRSEPKRTLKKRGRGR